jgi:hypothetical protein
MSIFLPAYRATIYKPRSQQAGTAETDILVPRSGALHTDECTVWTLPTAGTWKGYLRPVAGRRTSLNMTERTNDVGSIELEILDKRTGTDNAERWFAQFLVDSTGQFQLGSCLVEVDESLDDGCSWTRYFTGRIQTVRKSRQLTWLINVRDMSDDLKREIFTGGPPHTSVTYAGLAPLIPHHNTSPFHAWPAGTGAPGTKAVAVGADLIRVAANNRNGFDRWNIITKKLQESSDVVTSRNLGPAKFTQFEFKKKNMKMWVRNTATLDEGVFDLKKIYSYHDKLHAIGFTYVLEEQTATAFNYATWASIGSTGDDIEYKIYSTDALGGQSAVLIDDVHPVQLLQDIVDGYFGILSPTTGDPVTSLSRGSSFSTLIADTTFPNITALVTSSSPLNKWVTENISIPCGLALIQNADGSVDVVDVRPSGTAIGTLPTFVDADVIANEDGADVEFEVGDVVNCVDMKFYADIRLDDFFASRNQDSFPDVPPGLFEEVPQVLRYIPDDYISVEDHGLRKKNFDFKTMRFTPGDYIIPTLTLQYDYILNHLRYFAGAYTSTFARGSRELTLKTRRTSVPVATTLGSLRIIQVSTVYNPGAQLYSGQIVGRVLEKTEDNETYTFRFSIESITATGVPATQTANPPTISTPTLSSTIVVSGEMVNSIVTLNAQSEYAETWMAITDIATTAAPASTSSLWTFGVRHTVSGTEIFGPVPHNSRVWVRARTPNIAQGGSTQLQTSGWVYPSGTGYVDTSTLTALSSLVVSNITGGSADITWAGGVDYENVQVLLAAGTVATFSASHVIASFPHPPRNYSLSALAISTVYTVGVARLDGAGGTSAPVVATFTTLGATLALTRPAGVAFDPWTAIRGRVFFSDAVHSVQLERYPDTTYVGAGGLADPGVAPNTAVAAVITVVPQGNAGYFYDPTTEQYEIWWYRAKTLASSSGETDSGYTQWLMTRAYPPGGTPTP